ncbi:hypothetical protein [Pokkaliibacter plantistimulans]|uniref:hypothetical protein n=1 Tax=Pokkaliibacter plantistimulans TaxID=1635171 RepID=UPI00398FE094
MRDNSHLLTAKSAGMSGEGIERGVTAEVQVTSAGRTGQTSCLVNLQAVEKRYRGSRDKEETGEKAEFSELNEHFEPVFDAVFGNADRFSTPC